MNEPVETSRFTPIQLAYIDFLAACQLDTEGKKYTKLQWAQMNKVAETALYDWQKLPGFWQAVAEASPARMMKFVPKMNLAMVTRGMKGDTNAYKVVMNQMRLLQSERIETKNENTHEHSYKFAE